MKGKKGFLISHKVRSVALACVVMAFGSSSSFAADEYGTAEEAKAMLEAAVAALKVDEETALASFTGGIAPFKVKDLYVFCGKDGIMSAHGANPKLVGEETLAWKDKAGKLFVQEMYAVAIENEFKIVEYMWPRPTGGEPVQKASYVVVASSGNMCGVGYYK